MPLVPNSQFMIFNPSGDCVAQWNSGVEFLVTIDVDEDDNIYCASIASGYNTHEIQRFSLSGERLNYWLSKSGTEGALYRIAVSPFNQLLYAQPSVGFIRAFALDGATKVYTATNNGTLGEYLAPIGFSDAGKVYLASYSAFGSVTRRVYSFPHNLATGASWDTGYTICGLGVSSSTGAVYVTNVGRQQIRTYDSNGSFVRDLSPVSWPLQSAQYDKLLVDSSTNDLIAGRTSNDNATTYFVRYNSSGTLLSSWTYSYKLEGISICQSTGDIFCCFHSPWVGNNTIYIRRYTSNGTFLNGWDFLTNAERQVNTYVAGMKVCPISGNIVVVLSDSLGPYIPPVTTNTYELGRDKERLATAIDLRMGYHYCVCEYNYAIKFYWKRYADATWQNAASPITVSTTGHNAIKPGIDVDRSGLIHCVYESLQDTSGALGVVIIHKISRDCGLTWEVI